MIVHAIDGTYELFRHFYGLRRFNKGKDQPFGAVIGVLQTVLQMIEKGATHVGVATDHVIESFRNDMEVECEVAARDADGLPLIRSASVVTTARPLFTGNVYVRDRLAVA